MIAVLTQRCSASIPVAHKAHESARRRNMWKACARTSAVQLHGVSRVDGASVRRARPWPAGGTVAVGRVVKDVGPGDGAGAQVPESSSPREHQAPRRRTRRSTSRAPSHSQPRTCCRLLGAAMHPHSRITVALRNALPARASEAHSLQYGLSIFQRRRPVCATQPTLPGCPPLPSDPTPRTSL